MKKLTILTGTVLLSGLLAAAAMAAGAADPQTPPQAETQAQTQAQGAGQGEAVAPGTVPQAQVDYQNKREEMRQRRDELLKIREQAVQSGN